MARRLEFISHSPKTTRNLGKLLAQSLRGKVVICLTGDLGGGKTVFTQGMGRGLGIKERIKSPSFVLLKKYKVPKNKTIKYLYHLDCYRLKNSAEILGIGYEEVLEDKSAVLVIEWADRIKQYLPRERINIDFEFIDQRKRKITFSNL